MRNVNIKYDNNLIYIIEGLDMLDEMTKTGEEFKMRSVKQTPKHAYPVDVVTFKNEKGNLMIAADFGPAEFHRDYLKSLILCEILPDGTANRIELASDRYAGNNSKTGNDFNRTFVTKFTQNEQGEFVVENKDELFFRDAKLYYDNFLPIPEDYKDLINQMYQILNNSKQNFVYEIQKTASEMGEN